MLDLTQEYASYSEMFQAYLAEAKEWITAAELPLIHHARKLCEQLDLAGVDKAAMSSAYLQAIERLEKRKPAPKRQPTDEPAPGQSSIFEFLD